MTTYPMTMYGLREPQPGSRWRGLFNATWPAYRRWYLSQGRDARPSLTQAGSALARHMPELLPTWARLAEQADFDDDATTMLTHWNLPFFAPAGCSQIVTTDARPALLRNYDYSPALFECVSASTDYLQPVIGTSDCLWGLLDGMNAAGLVVSLTFGGDRTTGDGFAIPLVVRYLLETCETVGQARAALDRLPVAMTYNLTMVDSTTQVLTAHVGPGRPAEFRDQRCATNHRWDSPLDPAHAARYRSVERLDGLGKMVDDAASADSVAAALLSEPLYARDYAAGFGTIYTADYRPSERTLTYRWPGTTWTRTFESPDETVELRLQSR